MKPKLSDLRTQFSWPITVGIMISVDPSESGLHLVHDDWEHMLMLDMHGEL